MLPLVPFLLLHHRNPPVCLAIYQINNLFVCENCLKIVMCNFSDVKLVKHSLRIKIHLILVIVDVINSAINYYVKCKKKTVIIERVPIFESRLMTITCLVNCNVILPCACNAISNFDKHLKMVRC